jgi:DNA-binding transcriptional MerR regulator
MNNKIFTLDELCTLTDYSKRTARYYIQMGLLSRPIGDGRAAHYSDIHLGQLLQIKRLTEVGVSLERIREVLEGDESPVSPRKRHPGSVEVRSHLFVAPGIEIQISPEEAGMTPEQVRAFVREVMETADRVLSGAAYIKKGGK